MVTKNIEEYKGVFIYAQQVDCEISPIAFELLGKAKELAAELGTQVTAVLLGSKIKELASQLAEYGAAEVVDETVCLYKSLDFDKDFSIRGQFYRQLLPLLLSEKPEERSKAKAALKFGLCALDGKEL